MCNLYVYNLESKLLGKLLLRFASNGLPTSSVQSVFKLFVLFLQCTVYLRIYSVVCSLFFVF